MKQVTGKSALVGLRGVFSCVGVILLATLILAAGTVFASNTDTNEIEASVHVFIPAIEIEDVTSLRFGTVMPQQYSRVDITIYPNENGTVRNTTVPGTLIEGEGATDYGPAKFKVTGHEGKQFGVAVAQNMIELTGPGDPIQVSDFNIERNSYHLKSGGVDVTIGATLSLNAAQAPGTYDGTFEVTVQYE